MKWPWTSNASPCGWYLTADGREVFGPLAADIAPPSKFRPTLHRAVAHEPYVARTPKPIAIAVKREPPRMTPEAASEARAHFKPLVDQADPYRWRKP